MKHSPSTSGLGVAFNAFLFAKVPLLGDAPVTMLSALARLDVDPWQEAADLARLPPKAASERLAQLLAQLPHRQGVVADPQTTSTRMVGLLPASLDSDSGQPAASKSPRTAQQLLVVAGLGLGLAVLAGALISANSPLPDAVKPNTAPRVMSAGPPAPEPGPLSPGDR